MIVSPIKTQGKKTKIVPYIIENLPNMTDKLWIEPFLGSGVVLFNVNPKFALVCDDNQYIINFFNDLKSNTINSQIVRQYLEYHGQLLRDQGREYYYIIRKQFNETHKSLDFLFLNRSCFNGVMRFNNKGEFNVPFCNKNDRFAKALITKIVNQVEQVQKLILSHKEEWTFICCDWTQLPIDNCGSSNSIFYYDPPYIERHSTYFHAWTEDKNFRLFATIKENTSQFILSNWLKNDYRENIHINEYFSGTKFNILPIEHFYHVGGKETNRNSIIECIVKNY